MTDKPITPAMHAVLEYGEFKISFWGSKPMTSRPNGASMTTINAMVSRGLLSAHHIGSTVHYSPIRKRVAP